ncbi:MAG: hypothetical protein K1X66_04490 [Verrucomicrobiae bacterium]|nr:hypothetical protein [Verrucomicrobiae bacterium]
MRMVRVLGWFFIYVLTVKGWGSTKLNSPMMVGGRTYVANFVGGNSEDVVFVARLAGNQPSELFRVNYEQGGNVVNLSGILPPQASVSDFSFSPDKKWIIFDLLYLDDWHWELFSVPVAGGPVVKLNGALVNGGSVHAWWVSPDSKRVVYTADQQINDLVEIFSSRIEGGDNFRVNPDIPLWAIAFDPIITSDSQSVVYCSDFEKDNVAQIYKSPIQGGGSWIRLNGDLVPGGNVNFNFLLSPEGYVVYRADQDVDGMEELYSTKLDGTDNIKLNAPFNSKGKIFNMALNPQGNRVVYWGDVEEYGKSEVFSVPVGGGAVSKVSGPLVDKGSVFLPTVTPDGQYVVYTADQSIDNTIELYRSRVSGGENAKLNPFFGLGNNIVFDYVTTSNQVLYRVWNQNRFESFSSSLVNGTTKKINAPLTPGGSVEWVGISPDEKKTVYIADQEQDGRNELYCRKESGEVVKLNDPLVPGGQFNEFLPLVGINDASTHLIYAVDQDVDEVKELYVIPLVPPLITSPTNISLQVGEVLHYQITAKYGPILDYDAELLPAGAMVQSNQVTWAPTQAGAFSFQARARNDAGWGTTNVTVNVEPEPVVTPPSPPLPPEPPIETNKVTDCSLKAPFDVLFQKRKRVNGMRLISEGARVQTITRLGKKERLRGAGWLNPGQYGLIVQSNIWVKAILMSSNGSEIGRQELTQLPQRRFKIRATGDVNQDGWLDFAVSRNKEMGLLLSPNYSLTSLQKMNGSLRARHLVGLLGATSETKSEPVFIFNKKKKMWRQDQPRQAPVPFFELPKHYRARAFLWDVCNSDTSRLVITRRKRLEIVPLQIQRVEKPYISYRGLGKIVGPK